MSEQKMNSSAGALDLPPHGIAEDGTVTWKGKPLKVSDLMQVYSAIEKASRILNGESIPVAKKRWESARQLALATLERLPAEETLNQAIPELPPEPSVPELPPKFLKYKNGTMSDRLWYEDGLVKRKADLLQQKIYQQELPIYRKQVEAWQKYGGGRGIMRMLRQRRKFAFIAENLTWRIENPEIITARLPFEILPAGFWGTERLLAYLGDNGWRIQEIVPERLDHFFALKPQKVFAGNMYKEYREYLVFIFANDGSAVLESPFHGNATYWLKRDWFTLCQKSKSELLRDERATRVIHRDIPSWRREMCALLGKKMPKNPARDPFGT